MWIYSVQSNKSPYWFLHSSKVSYLKHLPFVDDGDSRLLRNIALLPAEAVDDST